MHHCIGTRRQWWFLGLFSFPDLGPNCVLDRGGSSEVSLIDSREEPGTLPACFRCQRLLEEFRMRERGPCRHQRFNVRAECLLEAAKLSP